MSPENINKKQRQRAPQKRAVESRQKILDAAERVFAQGGFDGAKVRDIAAEAGVPVGLVHHHGGGKEALFKEVLRRRAEILSALRIEALDAARAGGPVTLDQVLRAFTTPYFEQVHNGGPQWLAYARLVAIISADEKLTEISAALFDPTAKVFIQELQHLYPKAPTAVVAECFVYMVSCMLALVTSRFRIASLSGGSESGEMDGLLTFCRAGFEARLAEAGNA